MKARLGAWNAFWLIVVGLYFIVPLIGTLQFSLQTGQTSYGFDAYQSIFNDPAFSDSFFLSLKLAIATVALSLLLLVPTIYWVALRLPRFRRTMDMLAILPLVVPPITLAVGVLQIFQPITWLISGPQILVVVYVILALPYTYRALDAGMRTLNVRTLTEAAQSCGANWLTILLSVILPNLRFAMVSSAFLTLTLVMGEYTVSSLMLFNTFSVYMQYIGQSKANPAAALAIISLLLTWGAMFGILYLGRGVGRREVQIGGGR